ncbi:MAG: hypothetical protein IIC76_07125 [Bacteroidetes bacterium]|nr:hypothetical protein [Bacteroidota bacterium]
MVATELNLAGGEDVVHVFVPTSPNPTSGFILIVPQAELHPLTLSVEDGLKLVLSLGMIHPGRYGLNSSAQFTPGMTEKTAASGVEKTLPQGDS